MAILDFGVRSSTKAKCMVEADGELQLPGADGLDVCSVGFIGSLCFIWEL